MKSTWHRCSLLGGLVVVALAASVPALGEAPTITARPLSSVRVGEIIHAFASGEVAAQQALADYAFAREVIVQSIGADGEPTGQYQRASAFRWDARGKRVEAAILFPSSTLRGINLGPQDLESFAFAPFFLPGMTQSGVYAFHYEGVEKIDELELYVFTVAPREESGLGPAEKLFKGRIWVDLRELRIVKTRGKLVPEDPNNPYPVAEGFREKIDAGIWFPTFVYADDQLTFGNGNVVHLRLTVQYTNYVRRPETVKK